MSKRWLIGGAASLAVLFIASLVVGLTQSEDSFPAGTPEETVQRYLMAVQDEDFKTAHGLLSQELKDDCRIEDFAAEVFRDGKDVADSRVTLEDRKDLNGSVLVTTRVTRIRGSGPFGTSESSQTQRYTMVQEGGEWRFTHYPWPYFGCRGPFPERPRVQEPEVEPAPPPEPTPPAAPEPRRASAPTPDPTPTPELPPGAVLHKVDIKNFRHEPLTITVGESILWTNQEENNVLHSVAHTARERGEESEFSSANMQRGESFRHTFTKPGEYSYVCRIHPVEMRAVITVVQD